MADPVRRLRARFGADLVGLTDDEIEQIRVAQGVERLPAAYVRFLRVAGRKGHRLLHGTDAFFPVVLQIRGWTRELLEEAGDNGLLPAEAVVVALHQGYHASWCTTWREDDPPMVEYVEGRAYPAYTWPSFSAWLTEYLDRIP